MSGLKKVIIAAVLVRLLLIYFTNSTSILAQRVEISTPINNIRRVNEGVFLLKNNISPYQGNNCQQPPLVLAFLSQIPESFLPLLYVAMDVWIVLNLITLSKAESFDSFTPLSSTLIAICYLFNPFSLIVTTSSSLSVFNNFAITTALASAQKGKIVRSMMFLALATYLSIYPVMLIIPAIMLLSKKQFSFPITIGSVVSFLAGLGLFFYSSFLLLGNFDFISSFYGCIIYLSDFSPNSGLFWYFFIEMFDHFRQLFIYVFQLNIFAYWIPSSMKFRNEPLFLSFFLLAVIALFKPYPSIGDVVIYLSFIPFFHPIFKFTQAPLIVANVFVYSSIISVIFWYWWIYQGSGNANFYYAITLVYSAGQIVLVLDLARSALKYKLAKDNPNVNVHDLFQK